MTESKKLLIGFGVVGLLCLCIAGAAFFGFREFGRRMESVVNGDPANLEKAQEKIAGFDVPPGYKPIAMSLVVYDMVTLTPDSASGPGATIIMMQYNGLSSASDKQIEEQLRQAADQQGGQGGASMQVVDSFESEIRGETVTVTVSEGAYQSFTMRQLTTIFKGNNAPTILLIQGPVEYWDEQLVNDFIKSIR